MAEIEQIEVTDAATDDNLFNLLASNKNKSGPGDLSEHLQKMFNFFIQHYPGQALQKFEEVSYLIKQGQDISKYLKIDNDHDYRQLAANVEEYSKIMQVRFAGPQPEEEGGEIPEVAPVGFVQDLNAQQRIFSWAGVSFGEQEAYRLQKSLKKFAAEMNSSSTRFFGKITGTQSDYYVVEATVEGGDDEGADGEEKEPGFDAKGATGVNQYTYFVSKDSLSSWTKLPDISPSQIKAARSIKVLFSGDLERKIFTNPFFDGQEKHYLRAQIARITQSTTLLPKGLFKATEDSETREIEAVEPEEG